MDVKKRAKIITDWINDYCESASYKPKALVVGISGGIDSSLVTALMQKNSSEPINTFNTIRHSIRMQSLSNTYSKEEFALLISR